MATSVPIDPLVLDIMWHPTNKICHPWHPNTSQPAGQYELQHVVIGYRARKLITQAYEGLASGHNAALSLDLLQEIEAKQNKQKPQTIHRDHVWGRISAWIKGKIKRLLNR